MRNYLIAHMASGHLPRTGVLQLNRATTPGLVRTLLLKTPALLNTRSRRRLKTWYLAFESPGSLLLRRRMVVQSKIGIYSITVDGFWKRQQFQIAGFVPDRNRSYSNFRNWGLVIRDWIPQSSVLTLPDTESYEAENAFGEIEIYFCLYRLKKIIE